MQSQWSEREARDILGAWRKSGLTLERFAKDRGLVSQRLRWWLKKLESKDHTLVRNDRPLILLPVSVNQSKPRGEAVAVLLRTGHMIKVGRGFDEETFSRVVTILEGA